MIQQDGKDYLMECDIYEQQGEAGYQYQVFNATLLVCCDITNYYHNDREVFVSYGDISYQPQAYFNGVWERVDEELSA